MQMLLLYIDLEKERKGGNNGTPVLFFFLSSSFTRNNYTTLPLKISLAFALGIVT